MAVETLEEEKALIQNFADRIPSSARYLPIEDCEDSSQSTELSLAEQFFTRSSDTPGCLPPPETSY